MSSAASSSNVVVYTPGELRALKDGALKSMSEEDLNGLPSFEIGSQSPGQSTVSGRKSSLKPSSQKRAGESLEASRTTPTVNWGDEVGELSDNEDAVEDYGVDPSELQGGEGEDLEDVEPIEHIQNRWVPPSMRRRQGDDDGLGEESGGIVAKTKSVLNKLTVERFQKLSGAVEQIICDHAEAVEEIAHVVVLKARQEVHFGSLYANLCVLISGNQDDIRTDHTATRDRFKRCLLDKCQAEIQKIPDTDNIGAETPVKSRPEEGDDADADGDEDGDSIATERKYFFGLVNFIGHLYKTGFATCYVVHSVLNQFLEGTPFVYGSTRPLLLECVCRLLTIVGQKMDGHGVDPADISDELKLKFYHFNKKWLQFYFQVLETIVEQHQIKASEEKDGDGVPSVESRIVFSIQNLLELRVAHWEPRRTSMKAKSLEQIKADRDAEDARRKAEYLAKKAALKEQALHGRDFDEDGFETVAAGGRRARAEKVKKARETEYRIKNAMARGRYNKGGNGGGRRGNSGGGNRPPRHSNNYRNNKGSYNKQNRQQRNNNSQNDAAGGQTGGGSTATE